MIRWLFAILVIAILAVWTVVAVLPDALENRVPALAAQYGIEDLKLQVKGVTPRYLLVRRAGFSYPTDSGVLDVTLRDVTIPFDLRAQRAGLITAAQAHLRWRPEDTVETSTAMPPQMPALPLDGLSVKQFSFTAPGVELGGQLRLISDGDLLRGSLQDEQYAVVVNLPVSFASASLTLAAWQSGRLLDVHIDQHLPTMPQFTLSADLAGLLAWAQHSTWIPRALRETVRDYSISHGKLALTGSGLDALSLSGTLDAVNVSADGAVFDLFAAGDLHWQEDRLSLVLGKTSRLQLQRLPGLDVQGAVRSTAKTTLTAALSDNGELQRVALNGALAVDARIADGESLHTTLRAVSVPAFTPGTGLPASVTLQATDLTSAALPAGVGIEALQGSLRNDSRNVWQGNGEAQLEGIGTVHWALTHDAGSGEGYANVLSTVPLAEAFQHYHDILLPDDELLSVNAGTANVSARAVWQPGVPVRLSGRSTLEQVSAGYDGISIQALNGDADFDYGDVLTVSLAASIDDTRMANGMQARHTTMQGEYRNGGFRVRSLATQMFDGQLRVEQGELDPGEEVLAGELVLEGVELEALLRGLDVPGLSGTGRLSGRVPLRVWPDRLAVSDGHMLSELSGVIRYQASAAASEGNLALQALQDFHYQVLDTQLNYGEQGDYHIGLKLEGANPDLYDGHPVRLNLNIEGNLPGLIRASLLTGDFSRLVLKYVEGEQPQRDAVP